MTTKHTAPSTVPGRTTTVKPAPGVTFQLSLNTDRFAVSEVTAGEIEATLVLRVNDSAPLSLTFINGQEFDLEVRDAAGTLVSQWSRGKVFSDLAQTVQISGERKWTGSLPVPIVGHAPGSGPVDPMPIIGSASQAGSSGAPLSPPQPIGGINLTPVDYTLTGYLVTGGAVHPYSATIAFAVHPRPVLEMAASPA